MNKDWLDIDMLEDYLDGKLNAHDMHFVERAVLDDPFVAEALEGLSKSPRRANNLSLLQKQLQERTARNEQKKRVWSLTWQRLSIAATAAVLFVSAGIIFWMKADNRQRELAGTGKKVDVTIDTSRAPALAGRTQVVPNAVPGPVSDTPASGQALAAIRPAKNRTAAARPESIPARSEPAAVPADGEKTIQQAPAIAAAAEAYAPGRTEVSKAVIAGKVVSEEGRPVPGVTVGIPGRDMFVTTDRNGNFSLPAFKDEKITAASIGYTIASMVATPQKPVRITLKQDKNALSEQVVMGYGQAQQRSLGNTGVIPDSAATARVTAARSVSDARARVKATASPSLPATGWEDYNRYLQENSRLAGQKAANKLIAIGFSIEPGGKPAAFRVLLGDSDSDKKYIDELIRLIRTGPLWKYEGPGSTGKVTMVF